MTVTRDQAQMLTDLARACRPTGASRWDAAGVMAAIKQVADRQLATVLIAFVRGASDSECVTPMGVVTCPKYWTDSPAVSVFVPNVIPPAERCGICNKARSKCENDPRHADDDHVFDDGKRDEFDVHRVVAELKDQLQPVAPPPPVVSLDERLAAIPADRRDPGVEAVRVAMRQEASDENEGAIA